MKTNQERALDAGRRVQGFLDAQAAAIGTAVSASLRAKLDAAVAQLVLLQHQQETATSAAVGETVNQAALRRDLYEHLVVPVGTAARINLRKSTDYPALSVPASSERRATFVPKVNALIEAAVKYEQLFIDHGMAPDFLTQLRAGVAAVSASSANRANQLSLKAAASGGLVAANTAVRALIKMLNGVLSPVLKKNPTLSAGWRVTKLITQKPVTPLPTGGLVIGPAPTTTPAATGTPASTTLPTSTGTPAATVAPAATATGKPTTGVTANPTA